MIVPADDADTKKLEENNSNKKGDSKGSGRLENDSSNKEASPPTASTGPVAGSIKTLQDGDGSKRLVLKLHASQARPDSG